MQIKCGDWTSPDFGTFQDLIDKTLNVETNAMEKHTGLPFMTLAEGLVQGSMTSITAFVWILRKREEPTLKYHEVIFTVSELDLIKTDADEQREAAEKAEQEAAAADPTEPALELPDSDSDPQPRPAKKRASKRD